MIGTNTGVGMKFFAFVYAHALAAFAFVVLVKGNDWRLPAVLFTVIFIVVVNEICRAINKLASSSSKQEPPTQ